MTTEMLTLLPAPQILEISGADAVAFAQAQFSSNLFELANGRWQWSAWLSAQGRVRAFFHLLRYGDEHLRLVLRGGSAAKLRTELSRYVFRSKVHLRVVEDQYAYVARHSFELASLGEAPSDYEVASNADETCIALPGTTPRWLLLSDRERGNVDDSAASQNENALADIDANLIWLDPALEDRLLPAWIGLDALKATSTNKGCYPGQEIVARLHFKGGNKRRLHRITYRTDTLPLPATSLDESGEPKLVVCSAWSGEKTAASLAVINENSRGE